MAASSYQVVFTGALRNGVGRRQGIRLLAQLFNLDFEQIKRLLGSSRPVVKRCLSEREGVGLVRAFWQAGWRTELILDGNLVFDGSGHHATSSEIGGDVSKGRVLVAPDKSCSIEVPGSWDTFVDLNRGALIQSGNLKENQFLVVLSQKLADLSLVPSIGAYCSAQLKQCADKLYSGVILTPATPLEEGGYTGYFGEITAEVDTVPVTYLVACLQSGECVYTVFLWCETQQYRRRKQDFDRIVLSFCTGNALAPSEPDGKRVAPHRKVSTG